MADEAKNRETARENKAAAAKETGKGREPAKKKAAPAKKKKDRLAWFREVRSELKKVVWPTREAVLKNTGTVLLCSFLIGACIWIFDFAATNVVRGILAIFGG